MIYSRELNKSFDTEELLFSELKANKDDILALKKAQIQKSCEKGTSISIKNLDLLKLTEEIKNLKIDDDYYYIAVNTTKVLDSHGDLHIDGLWKKTVKDQQGRNYLVADHKLELDNVIANKSDIEMVIAEIPFSLIGKSYSGNTQALIYKISKDKIKPKYKEWLDNGDVEASVRMRYVSIKMAMNSTNENDKEEYKTYNQYVSQIANKDEFESIPYFFVVTEAENVKESSLVLFGSNPATGQINNKEVAEPITTKKAEPTEVTQTEKRKLSII
jgi:hypothetical protein